MFQTDVPTPQRAFPSRELLWRLPMRTSAVLCNLGDGKTTLFQAFLSLIKSCQRPPSIHTLCVKLAESLIQQVVSTLPWTLFFSLH